MCNLKNLDTTDKTQIVGRKKTRNPSVFRKRKKSLRTPNRLQAVQRVFTSISTSFTPAYSTRNNACSSLIVVWARNVNGEDERTVARWVTRQGQGEEGQWPSPRPELRKCRTAGSWLDFRDGHDCVRSGRVSCRCHGWWTKVWQWQWLEIADCKWPGLMN